MTEDEDPLTRQESSFIHFVLFLSAIVACGIIWALVTHWSSR